MNRRAFRSAFLLVPSALACAAVAFVTLASFESEADAQSRGGGRSDSAAPAARGRKGVTVFQPGKVLLHAAPLPDPKDTPNAAFLKGRVGRVRKNCGARQVAPDVWVRVDCQADTKGLAKAINHASEKKLKLYSRLGSARAKSVSKAGLFAGQQAPTPQAPKAPKAPNESTQGQGAGGALEGDGEVFPDTVDHRAMGLEGPVRNQAAVGSCTAFSLAATFDNAIRRSGKTDAVSSLHIWSHYGFPSIAIAGDANMLRNVTTEAALPYSAKSACALSSDSEDDCGGAYGVTPNTADKDATLQAALKKGETQGTFQLASVERLTTPVNVDEVVAVLASGMDLWVAFKINDWDVKNGEIPDWNDWGGGHAVTLAGYRTKPSGKQFLIHNSWSSRWGDGGYAWVSEAMVKKWMYHAYKVKLNGVEQVPTLTDEDCPGDEVVDAGTGKCAKMCASDVNPRPSNGKCL
ncbi:MAG: C1 family peptidase [Polyangiaceae bacterium]